MHEIDLNENSDVEAGPTFASGSEDEEEDDDEEGDPLSAMLDGNGDAGEDSESGEEEEDSESEAEDALVPSDDDDDAGSQHHDALDQLGTFIDGLTPLQKRKASELDDDRSIPRKRKRRVLAEQNEAGAESEYATRGTSHGTSSSERLRLAPNFELVRLVVRQDQSRGPHETPRQLQILIPRQDRSCSCFFKSRRPRSSSAYPCTRAFGPGSCVRSDKNGGAEVGSRHEANTRSEMSCCLLKIHSANNHCHNLGGAPILPTPKSPH